MRRIFLSVILILIPLGAAAQIVNIPDDNLRQAINTTLGKAPGASISRLEMATLTHFEAHDADITDLTGLEFAKNLREIRCNNNLISDLSPLAGLIKLDVVEFRNNVIDDLSPLKDLINLTWVIVNTNIIDDLSPLEGLMSLHGLEISDNLISDLSPIGGLTSLTRIWMSDNPPMDLSPLSGAINLQTYRSWGTPILDFSALAELPKLRVLDMCGAEVSDISDLEGLTHLRELYLVGNEITDISPLASLTGLTRLSLRHNEVLDVSPLADLKKLTWIELADNEILDFSPLDGFPASTVIISTENPGFTQRPSKLRGNWLWMIAPTGNRSGANAAASGIDFLAQASGRKVTESDVAGDGATAGDSVGDKVWSVGDYLSASGNNLNEMANTTGLAFGDVDHHVAYGLLTFDSPRVQTTTMYVGSGDAVKVWLNGNVVHTNAVNRDAQDWTYQDQFPVTFKEGTNRLLTAVYEGKGWWSGFFGFDAAADFTSIRPDTPVVPIGRRRAADVDGDGKVSIFDMLQVVRRFDTHLASKSGGRVSEDINDDGVVNINDLLLVAQHINAPVENTPDAPISPELVQQWIDMAWTAYDGSVEFQKGITRLENLLMETLKSDKTEMKTAVFANYPNPFNPETWIPYQLAQAGEVSIDIYAADGVLVRTLQLGHQSAGIYKNRSRAAYWDGKNAVGEPVASGVYFYTFTAGDFTGTRRMLMVK